jgi:hypothetical protein
MAASGLNYEAEVFAAGKDWQRAIAGWVLHLGACALGTRHGRSLSCLDSARLMPPFVKQIETLCVAVFFHHSSKGRRE